MLSIIYQAQENKYLYCQEYINDKKMKYEYC